MLLLYPGSQFRSGPGLFSFLFLVYPHPLLDKMRVPLSSSKPPLFRQH
jgi:hypothetical protein